MITFSDSTVLRYQSCILLSDEFMSSIFTWILVVWLILKVHVVLFSVHIVPAFKGLSFLVATCRASDVCLFNFVALDLINSKVDGGPVEYRLHRTAPADDFCKKQNNHIYRPPPEPYSDKDVAISVS